MNHCNEQLKNLLTSYDAYRGQSPTSAASSSSSGDPHNTTLFALFKNLETSGLQIHCKVCSNESVEGTARAYLRSYPFEITLCANRLHRKENELQEALVHEATHAFDLYHQRYSFGTCEGLAATEIRAAKNAECKKMLPMGLDEKYPSLLETFPMASLRENCIKKHAVKSTSNLVGHDEARKCVELAWKVASADIEPKS